MTYYCIGCSKSHTDIGDGSKFRTGFHSYANGLKEPAGLCALHRSALTTAQASNNKESSARKMAG
ncbi:hypothetical protein ACFFK0_11685 [Paenibacillus chartarius]|uniref:DUF3973 domain-containing protein n=1 Tax=Paenibacillus chartarius TaxID=747481 RepID=A0ABV6DKH0_9BACL